MNTSIDICSNKHGGNPESRAANERNLRHREIQRQRVLELITEAGSRGLSMKEVAAAMDTQFSSVSGRGTELKRDGAVEKTGERRDGSAVLRATRNE